MAYLHCHSCDWSQDDFWSRRYNPLTKFWTDIKWLWKPHVFEMDEWFVNELTKYTHVPIWRGKAVKGQCRVFSWNWFILETVKELKHVKRQKWWTCESWEKD